MATLGNAVNVTVGVAMGVMGETGFGLRVGVTGGKGVSVGRGSIRLGRITVDEEGFAAQALKIKTMINNMRFMRTSISTKINGI